MYVLKRLSVLSFMLWLMSIECLPTITRVEKTSQAESKKDPSSHPFYHYQEKLMEQNYSSGNDNDLFYGGAEDSNSCYGRHCERESHQMGFLKWLYESSGEDISSTSETFDPNTTPVVIWHGLGQSCCEPAGIARVKAVIEKETKAYVVSIKVGTSVLDDIINSFFRSANSQVEFVCQMLAKDPRLSKGYHAVGFSQGGQLLRAVAQRCPNPPMKNLITLGSQHQGIYGIPKCPGFSAALCSLMRRFLSQGVYTKVVQTNSVVAQYWHDALNPENYTKFSTFIGVINNEGPNKNETYKQNLLKLNKFIMVKNTNDSTVIPIASQHFEFYVPGSDSEILPLRKSTIYIEDWIGLKELDQSGRLIFLEVGGDHIEYETKWFVDNIVKAYLKS